MTDTAPHEPSATNREPTAAPLADQVVVISGGGRGLGAAISRAFLDHGARVAIGYHCSREAAEVLAAEYPGRGLAVPLDVTAPDQIRLGVDAAAEHFGEPVTTVVNNALVNFTFDGEARPRVPELDPTLLASQLTGSVYGPLALVQATIPGMIGRGFGRIINIGSNLVQHPVVPYHDYTAAKAALLALTRTFAHDLGPHGITVNMVSAGLLRTTDASAATPETIFDAIAAGTPLGRVTSPAELADAVLFFASPWARAVTGQNLIVDGGLVKG
ncbi:3-oxoacyl-[acyl-carrier protein] reductase [Pseudonocardia ammonioxydans]|uniref:3-oxoacyl-[acyl-carrier protein] reductase n=1 Tax=Pseudonocardia ammonioxydans TaxID=260086 RepID=A0A1I5GMU8_PSUAM|nr:3-oxoacyl-ACP reductase [Pseudonocardia ammonioxydans]SFO37305.1 3-oxoacyl-[acyl-carrier protein] reductase [Pseudonocardia ammonioxydans]